MKRLWLAVILVAGGCDTMMYGTPNSFVAPDGRQAFSVGCPEGLEGCHTRARRACDGKNYEVIGQTELATNNEAASRREIERSMRFICAT